MNLTSFDLSILKQVDPIVWIVLLGVMFFYCVFSILMSGSSKKHMDLDARIKEISAEGPALIIPDEEKKPVNKKKQQKKIQNDKMKKRIRQIEDELYNVGIEMPVKDFVLYWLGSLILLSLALMVAGVNTSLICIVVAFIAFFPALLINSKKKKRCAIIEGQLLECIQVLSNALKAGHSFTQAMGNIASEMDGPIAEEFNRVFLETQHGMNMDDSLEAMCARVGSDDLSMMCTAIEIQRQVGGNLSQILLNISGTIKSRLKLKADVKVKTSSGRISGIIIGSLPILLFILFLVINPGYMTFFTDGNIIGLACIAFCVCMEITGFIVINKIITIKY